MYKIPEAEEILQPQKTPEGAALIPAPMVPLMEKPQADKQKIEAVLDNLGKMEVAELPIQDVDSDTVKELLGSLYMELLFPHNDRERFFSMEESENLSVFNKKV